MFNLFQIEEKLRDPQQFPVWKPAGFVIPKQNFKDLKRIYEHPFDCVINAFEVLKLVDSRCAGALRVFHYNQPATIEEIQRFFDIVRPDKDWRWRIVDSVTLDELVGLHLYPLRAMFVGVIWPNGEGHVILITKDVNGSMFIIDPQQEENVMNCTTHPAKCKVYADHRYFLLEMEVTSPYESSNNERIVNVRTSLRHTPQSSPMRF